MFAHSALLIAAHVPMLLELVLSARVTLLSTTTQELAAAHPPSLWSTDSVQSHTHAPLIPEVITQPQELTIQETTHVTHALVIIALPAMTTLQNVIHAMMDTISMLKKIVNNVQNTVINVIRLVNATFVRKASLQTTLMVVVIVMFAEDFCLKMLPVAITQSVQLETPLFA